jgi:hypothetical protein
MSRNKAEEDATVHYNSEYALEFADGHVSRHFVGAIDFDSR